MSRILKNLNKASGDNEWKAVILYLNIIKVLVLANLAYVINVQIVKELSLSNCDMDSVIQEVPLEDQEGFIDLQCYMTECDGRVLLVAMNSLVKENPDVRWTELTWFIDL